MQKITPCAENPPRHLRKISNLCVYLLIYCWYRHLYAHSGILTLFTNWLQMSSNNLSSVLCFIFMFLALTTNPLHPYRWVTAGDWSWFNSVHEIHRIRMQQLSPDDWQWCYGIISTCLHVLLISIPSPLPSPETEKNGSCFIFKIISR